MTKRFLHLERERKDESDRGSDAPSRNLEGRFEDLTRPSEPSGPGEPMEVPTGLQPERFTAEPPAELGLDTAAQDGPAFLRCMACQRDNSRFVEVCERCGALLTTPAQRAYNAEVMLTFERERLRQEAEVAALEAERSAEATRQAALTREWQRAQGIRIAEEVRDRLEAQLDESPSLLDDLWQWIRRSRRW